jgi:ATP-dependent Clp protease adaptor protein ClpS
VKAGRLYDAQGSRQSWTRLELSQSGTTKGRIECPERRPKAMIGKRRTTAEQTAASHDPVGGVVPARRDTRRAPVMADDDKRRRNGDPGAPGTAVISKTRPQVKRPNLYRVLILNDDYTPMEFVVHVIERFFSKDHEAANRIMLHVHNHGIGECGVYTYEVAETKVTQVMDFARKHQHPLQCVMEKK